MEESPYGKRLRRKGLVKHFFVIQVVKGFFYKTGTNKGKPYETGFLFVKFDTDSKREFEGWTAINSPVVVSCDYRLLKDKEVICCYQVVGKKLILIWLAAISKILPSSSSFPILGERVGQKGVLELKPTDDIMDARHVDPRRPTPLFYKGVKGDK